jgi:hypothetical protein
LRAVSAVGSSRRTLAVVLAVAALGAIALAGCGGSSSSTTSTPVDAKTRAYLTSMCTAMSPVIKDFGGFQAALKQAKTPDLAKFKQNIEAVLATMSSHAATAVSGLKSAGAPDISHGTTIAAGVVGEFTAFHQALAAAESQAKALTTTNAHAFQLAAGGLVATLGSSIGSAGKAVGQLGQRLKAPSLANAQKQVPACKSLGM